MQGTDSTHCYKFLYIIWFYDSTPLHQRKRDGGGEICKTP
jgi:hypothetical protein